MIRWPLSRPLISPSLNSFEFSHPPEFLYNHLVEIGQSHALIKVAVVGRDAYRPHISFGSFPLAVELENAKRDLQGFEPQFIFRIIHLELL